MWAQKLRFAFIGSLFRIKIRFRLLSKVVRKGIHKIRFKLWGSPIFGVRRRMMRIGALILGICIIGGSTFYYWQYSPIYLLADGKQIALASGKSQAEKALVLAQSELASELGTTVLGTSAELSWQRKGLGKGVPLTEEKLVAVFKERLNWLTDTAALMIEGKPVMYLASMAEAQEVLEELKSYYLPDDEAEIKIEKSEFKEDIKIVAVQGLAEQIKPKDEALTLLTQGQEEMVEHTVQKGESLWTIARENDLTVAELQEMNPKVKGTYLQPGEILNLTKIEPLVTVVATATMTVEEKVPYKVVYENDSTLWTGQQKVKEAGTKGAREVTYRLTLANDLELGREILAKETIREPQDQIVRKGTKVMVASRGSGGSGPLSWPTRGQITSPYGAGRGHTGIDIDGSTGDPIYAAGSGTVIYAGWKGSYGYCVDVDHGQGLSTRYAHLNKIDVSVGQKVSTQTLVGKMGSTGRSTGSHLHFEVRVNGKYTNPLNYLN